jgi:hypothetical protein
VVVLCGGRSWRCCFWKVEERRPGKRSRIIIKTCFPSVVYCRN